MADIDHFKAVNDSLGHGAGDIALKEFTHRLARVIRQTDQLGRYGGEEFLIIAAGPLTHDTSRKQPNACATPSLPRLSTSAVRQELFLRASVRSLQQGINGTAQEVVAAADRALYAAKDAGRNQVVIG